MVIIMRGPSGSGKSMLAEMIRSQGPVVSGTQFDSLGSPWRVFSPDDYFHGVRFSPSLLPEAHRICLRKFSRNVVMDVCDDQGRPYSLIVDAPNTTVGDVSPYARLAAAYGNSVKIVTMSGYGIADCEFLGERSPRKTPHYIVGKQMEDIGRTRAAMMMFGEAIEVPPDLNLSRCWSSHSPCSADARRT